MMAERGIVFPAFHALLTHPRVAGPARGHGDLRTSGLKSGGTLSSALVQALWEEFPHLEDPVKGDILYLFGQSREPAAFPLLEAVLGGSCSPELREAAEEALESLARGTLLRL